MKPQKCSSMILICLLMAACSEKKNLDEMHDATVKMNETTGQMNRKTEVLADTSSRLDQKTGQLLKSTDDMSQRTQAMLETSDKIQETSKELRDTTDELYDALRQGNALQLRREAYDSVLKSPSLFRKVSEAAKYFMSFEVQLWNQFAQDGTEEKRDILAQQAAQEFFMEVEELAPRDGSIDPTAAPDPQNIHSKSNHTASFNAFALSMHQMNRKQATVLKQQENVRPLSMLSLTEDALLAKNQLAQGVDMGSKNGFIREILAHEPKAIQLLQTRYNTFPLVFIDFVSQIGDKNIFGKAKMVLFGWDFNMDSLNAVQSEYLQTEVLSQALEARDFLRKIGVKPQMDSNVARLLKKMRIQSGPQKTAEMAAQQAKMMGLLQELQKGL